MVGSEIAEHRKPQDGKIKFKLSESKEIELRVATLPTAGYIEDVVMRILATSEPLPLDKTGFSERNLKALKDMSEPAVRHYSPHRLDRLWEHDDASLCARQHQYPGHQDMDR